MTKKVFIFIWFISAVFLFDCRNNNLNDSSPYRHYEHLLTKELSLSDSVKVIYVLSDTQCYACNIKFAKLIEQAGNDASALLIINVPQTFVDIGPFRRFDNVVFNFHKEDTFFNRSKIIYRNKCHIRHIIPVEARTIRHIESDFPRIFLPGKLSDF